jgi:hypothetical protein
MESSGNSALRQEMRTLREARGAKNEVVVEKKSGKKGS